MLLDGNIKALDHNVRYKYAMMIYERINHIDHYLFEKNPRFKSVVMHKIVELIPDAIQNGLIPLLRELIITCQILEVATYLDEYLGESTDEDFIETLIKIQNDPWYNLTEQEKIKNLVYEMDCYWKFKNCNLF